VVIFARPAGRPALFALLLVVDCLLLLTRPSSTPVAADTPTPSPTLNEEKKGEALALFQQASSLYQNQDLEGALNKFSQAAAVFEMARDPEDQWTSLMKLADIDAKLGRYDDAIGSYEQARRLTETMGNRDLEYTTLVSLGGLYNDLGQLEEAALVVQRILDLTREGKVTLRGAAGPQAEVEATLLLASVYSLIGDTSKEFSLYAQALELARQSGLHEQEGKALFNTGVGYAKVGQFDKAIDYLQQARSTFAEGNNKDTNEFAARTLSILIIAHNYLREYPDALALEGEALARAEGDASGEASVLLNIGDVYRNRADFEKAPADSDKALEYYNRANAIASQAGKPGLRSSILRSIGNLEVREARFDSALDHLQQALELAPPGPPYDPSLLRDIGYANEKLGRPDVAKQFYDDSIAKGEQIRQASQLEDFRLQIAELYGKSYGYAAMLRFHLDEGSEAFDLSEKARARTFLDLLRSKRVDIGGTTNADLVERERDLRNELAKLQDDLANLDKSKQNVVGSFEAEIQKKQHEFEEVRTQLRLVNPDYYSLVTAEPLKLSQVEAMLDSQTTLLSYFVTEENTLAFVVARGSFKVVALGIGREELHTAIESFRTAIDHRATATEQLEQLHGRLLAPILGDLKTPNVVIVPFGDLHYLPFAALTDGTRYFGDSHVLSYLPSASALQLIQAKRENSTGEPFVLSYDLPEGRKEAEAVADLFHVKSYLDSQASESRLRKGVQQAGILHIAAHGELTAGSPLFSRVLLAPDSENDGSLEVHEVYDLDLRETGMVVLSACQTGLGAVTGGDDVVGLTRAFIYAGTPTVVASLWNVNDEATKIFMESFYGELKQGRPKGEALQVAQEVTREQKASPYYWAAFTLAGDPGPITIQLGNEGGGFPLLLPIGAVGAVVLGMGAILWLNRRRIYSWRSRVTTLAREEPDG